MENSEGVMENSPALESEGPLDYEGRMVDALNEMSADANEDSSSSAPQGELGETEPDSDESEVEASADPESAKQEANAETETESEEEVISKTAFLKRVNGLNASKRKLEKESIEFQKEISEYREAFKILAERVQAAEGKLREYEEVDPREEKILEYERSQQAQEIRRRIEAEHQERLAAMQQEAYVDQRADEIVATAQHLAEKYPTITAEELVYKFRNSDESLDDLAKSMHSNRYAKLKTMFAKEKKPSAPKKIKPQGSMASIQGTSEEDMLEYLQTLRS
jgi:hypothetical protein